MFIDMRRNILLAPCICIHCEPVQVVILCKIITFLFDVFFMLFSDTCQEHAEISHIWKPNKDRANALSLATKHRTRSRGKNLICGLFCGLT